MTGEQLTPRGHIIAGLLGGPPAFRSKGYDIGTQGIGKVGLLDSDLEPTSDDERGYADLNRAVNLCVVCGGGRLHRPGCPHGMFEADARTDSIR